MSNSCQLFLLGRKNECEGSLAKTAHSEVSGIGVGGGVKTLMRPNGLG